MNMDSVRPSNFFPSQHNPYLPLVRVLLLVWCGTVIFFRHRGRSYLLYHWRTDSPDGERVPAVPGYYMQPLAQAP